MGEPMNASPHHSKVKVSLTMADSLFVAGGFVAGKMEMECRTDKGLGINVMMVELFAIQELTSRDHSATSTFLHSRRLFQGPGLPPSNAVEAHPRPGDPPLPRDYHQARRGQSTFLFRFPLPESSPSTISFGSGLARIRYEVRASVGVAWKGERKLVTDRKEVEVVELFEEDFTRIEPEGVVVGENGKMWVQGKVVGGVLVAGESACVELSVKNHSSRKNTGLFITLTRSLHLPNVSSHKAPLQISDTLTNVAFRGPEYVIPPGAEGVASLVFDVPRYGRGVKGGTREGARDEEEARMTEALFEVRCVVGIRIGMGIGSKDINLDLPVVIIHPAALPALPSTEAYSSSSSPFPAYPSTPSPHMQHPHTSHSPTPYPNRSHTPYTYNAIPPISPPPTIPIQQPYVDQGQVWFPPPPIHAQQALNPYQYFTPQLQDHQYHFSPPLPHPTQTGTPPLQPIPPLRPSSAGPAPQHHLHTYHHHPLPDQPPLHQEHIEPTDPEEGKGERASRIAYHLRFSSRNRSVSPTSHRFPLPGGSGSVPIPIPGATATTSGMVPTAVGMGLEVNTSISSPQGALVHSPRPLLSPKHSYTFDHQHHSLPKSERVEELERMADEVDRQRKDLSGDIPMIASSSSSESSLSRSASAVAEKEMEKEKSLPGLPVSTRTGHAGLRVHGGIGSSRPAVHDVFTADIGQGGLEKTPPTPLNAITPLKVPPRSGVLASGGGGGESGLDALERRLLAEVGTKKLDGGRTRTMTRALPIPIPMSMEKKTGKGREGVDGDGNGNENEPVLDSAISSLRLADQMGDLDHEHEHERDSDERTHKAGKESISGDDRDDKGRHGGGVSVRSGKEKDKDLRKGKKKGKEKDDGGKDKDARMHRKTAKGRVAAWLGGIDPDVPPPEDGELQMSINSSAVAVSTSSPVKLPTPPKEKPTMGNSPSIDPVDKDVVSSAPNPRSSGFVPIGTFKRDTMQRNLVNAVPTDPALPSAVGKVKYPTFILRSVPPAVKAVQVVGSPPKPKAEVGEVHGAKRKDTALQLLRDLPSPRQKDTEVQPRRALASPNSAVTYDIRSARGGRGGKVTTVASLWASGAVRQSDEKPRGATLLDRPGAKHLRSAAESPSNRSKSSPDLCAPSDQSNKSKAQKPYEVNHLRSIAELPASSSIPTPPPEPHVDNNKGKRAAPMIKSSSVPAIVSSSHAKPTLSSSASLARPFQPPGKRILSSKLPTTMSEARSEPVKPHTRLSPASTTPGDLAFGQARLRDLIKKYQGQAS